MSIAPLPTPLQDLGGRRFSFYPPIRNLGPNEWLYRRTTWSECVVMNARSGEEVWIPRMFLGEVSMIDEPMMLVRLNRELEWKAGVVSPRQRHVIEFPGPAPANLIDETPRFRATGVYMAPVVSIRLEQKPESRTWKWIGAAVVLGAVACTILSNISGQAQIRQRSDLFRGYRPWLQLTSQDDFRSTIRKQGTPTNVTSTTKGDRVVQTLSYVTRQYSVVLMGTSVETARYIGTLDAHGRILHAVHFYNGASAEPFLLPSNNVPPAASASGSLRWLSSF